MKFGTPSREMIRTRKSSRFVKKAVLFLAIAIWFSAEGAMAQTRFGLRAGASMDPDQFHFGFHVISDPLIPNLTFRPNLEIGLGNNRTVAAANIELAFGIPIPETQFSIYAGAGPALIVTRFDDSAQQNRGTDIGGGFNFLFGLEHASGLLGEVKVGAIDSPEVKITLGYTF